MSEFVAVEWFGREDKIGIVLTYDEFDGFKCRMAPIPYNPDVNIPVGVDNGGSLVFPEDIDIRYLMENAAKVPFEWACGFFKETMMQKWLEVHLEVVPEPPLRYDSINYDLYTLEKMK